MTRLKLCSLLAANILAISFGPSAQALPGDVKTLEKPKALYEIPRKHLYGIGLAEDPAGARITIVNGNIYVASADAKSKLVLGNSMKTVARRLAYAVVTSWIEVPLALKIETPESLGGEISKALRKLGFENARNVPFLLKGKFQRVETHLEEATSEKPVARNVAGPKIAGLVVGLFAKTTAARAEPEAYSFVWNFISDDQKVVGAIDQLTFAEGDHVTLFLPK